MKKIYLYLATILLVMSFSSCSEEVKIQNDNTSENLGKSIEIEEFQNSLLNAVKDRSNRTGTEPMELSEQPIIVEKSKDLLRANGYSNDDLENLKATEIISMALKLSTEKTTNLQQNKK